MQKSRNIFIIIFGAIVIVLLSLVLVTRDDTIIIDNDEFSKIIKEDNIRHVTIDNNYIYIKANKEKYKIAKDLVDLKSIKNIVIEVNTHSSFDKILGTLGIIILILLGFAVLINAFYRIFKKDSIAKNLKENLDKNLTNRDQNDNFSSARNIIGESNFDLKNTDSIIKFDDIAGVEEVKEDLLEIIDYLKNPKKYQSMGIHLPKGVLLVGPPGVGKTMIAKAIAGEANVPFFYQSGSSFAQIYVGVGAKRVRELFARAKQSAPSIIFIDEIDAVGKSRGGNRNDERETTLNQLLTEMDGFEDNKGVIILGATNRIEILDSALLRAGRFDRRIYIDLPDLEERMKIIELYLKDKNHKVNINEIAKQSVGFSSAALASLVNEASLNALRKNSTIITNDDFYSSRDKIAAGIKKQLSFSDDEKNIIALYQAAKAISAYWCDIDFDKISLIGDGLRDSDKNIFSKTDLINRIKVALSGNVVLEMNVGETYTNCIDDIKTAREIAFDMSEKYAMADRIITDSNNILYILEKTKEELKIFFKSAKPALDEVKEILLKNEKITKEELSEVFKRKMFN